MDKGAECCYECCVKPSAFGVFSVIIALSYAFTDLDSPFQSIWFQTVLTVVVWAVKAYCEWQLDRTAKQAMESDAIVDNDMFLQNIFEDRNRYLPLVVIVFVAYCTLYRLRIYWF